MLSAISAIAALASVACAKAAAPDPEVESPITQADDCETAQASYDDAQKALASCRLRASDEACRGAAGADCESCIEVACSDESNATKAAASLQSKCQDGGTPLEVHVSFECSTDASAATARDR